VGDKKVDFIVCGVQKAGTTALYKYLTSYSEVAMSHQKEVHFFDDESQFSDGCLPDYRHYHSYFQGAKEGMLWGEVTPIYIYWKDAPRRMWEYNPDLKIILVLRNPVDRAYSHWNMEFQKGKELLNFSDAIRQEKNRVREALPLQHRVYSYTDRGFYMRQIYRLWDFFPKEQVLILKYEDLLLDRESALFNIESFLGLERQASAEQVREHVSLYKEEIKQSDYQYLIDMFREEIKQVEHELRWDCSDWF